MKKYFLYLLITSCNGLGKSTSNNMDQVHSDQGGACVGMAHFLIKFENRIQ